ncbi:MAG: nucleoside-diphosphate kinase [Candidatus Pacearchaeota archaeon]|nr:nucleoside-diphosphate kinase [Candidatus Pacearchaeota archaeon]MDE1848436.1 nucleoside-diphosphate kinase [Nanoarchaeota archaeon]
MNEKTLVLIKPDAVAKGLTGNIISDLDNLGLKMIGLKLVKVTDELAKAHYLEHKERPFFNDLILHITGKLHNNAPVIAIVYEGESAIEKIRKLAGSTNPEKAELKSLRGKYGRIHSETKCLETVIHSSDSAESAKREIALWFAQDELIK